MLEMKVSLGIVIVIEILANVKTDKVSVDVTLFKSWLGYHLLWLKYDIVSFSLSR
jgi:hypothetical protein